MRPIPDDWHRDFFGGLWREVQRKSFGAEENAEMANVLADVLQLQPGARILDVPCGDGRITIELASRGFAMTGVDREGSLLALARESAAERGLDIAWHEQDMWKLDAGTGYDAVICPWTSLGYGSRNQDQDFFVAVGRSLAGGGCFFFETHVYETLLHDFEERLFRWAGDVLVAEEREFVPESGELHTDWTFSREGEIERRRSAMQLYTVRELDSMLEAAGMKTVASWGSWDLDAFELGSPILLNLAQKS